MSTTLPALVGAAKAIAQDSTKVPLLQNSEGDEDYKRAVTIALPIFDADVPNVRTLLYTVPTSQAFRFVLLGTGAILASGLDVWVKRRSAIRSVINGYDTTIRGQSAIDRAYYRVLEEPSATVLELLQDTPSQGSVLRLEYQTPHVVDAADAAATSVLPGDLPAIQLLVASKILEMYATRCVQNTGGIGLPLDVVNRQSQAQDARAAAKSLYGTYQAMVGQRDASELSGAGVVDQLPITGSSPYGFVFRRPVVLTP